MVDLPLIDGCCIDKIFDDKPDNQPIHYAKRGLSNDVGLDLWRVFVVSKFQRWKQINGACNKRNKKFIIA
jgi:hypothetical protein